PEERAERPQRPEPPWKRRARRSLRLAVVEGATSKAAGTIVDNATAPLAIALQATSYQLGLLNALPKVMSVVAQLLAPWAKRQAGGSRRLLFAKTLRASVAYAGVLGVGLLQGVWRVWGLVGLVVAGTAMLD